ncbi:MAG: MAPEG family protein [Halieaceae bacterium]
MFESYNLALLGVLMILATLVVQSLVATVTKAKQPGAIPGKIDESLGHDSFVFRSHRTVQNSLENLPAMLGTCVLAILAGANPLWTGILVWTYALARIIHMVLYYKIATDINPSPRSWFFLLGFFANVALLVLAGTALS